MREVTADRNATLQYQLTQIVGYADNICIMGRMKDAVKQISEELGLSFDVNGTKLMVQSRHDTTHKYWKGCEGRRRHDSSS